MQYTGHSGTLNSNSLSFLSFNNIFFHTPPHDSGGAVWVHVGRQCVCLSICISFPDDNLSKHQWIFTKLGMFVDVVEIWFRIANGQILTELSA